MILAELLRTVPRVDSYWINRLEAINPALTGDAVTRNHWTGGEVRGLSVFSGLVAKEKGTELYALEGIKLVNHWTGREVWPGRCFPVSRRENTRHFRSVV